MDWSQVADGAGPTLVVVGKVLSDLRYRRTRERVDEGRDRRLADVHEEVSTPNGSTLGEQVSRMAADLRRNTEVVEDLNRSVTDVATELADHLVRDHRYPP